MGNKIQCKVVSIKLNSRQEKRNGDTYKAHVLKIETEDGDEQTYKIPLSAKPAQYVKDLKKGDKIALQTIKTDWGKKLVAVYQNKPRDGKGSYDPLGSIQGMVLKAAIDVAIKESSASVTVENILEATKIIIKAKSKVDKLVAKSFGKDSKTDDEDTDNEEDVDEDEVEDEENDEDEDDEESNSEEEGDTDEEDDEADDEKPKKKSRKGKPVF